MNVTVLSAEEVRDKGDFKVFKVRCKDADGVEIEADRASKWPPKAGDQGTIESTQYGPKFIPASAGGGANNKGRQRDPAAEANRQASIIHQHSQSCALEILKASGEAGEHGTAELVKRVQEVARELTIQVVAVGKQAEAAKK